MSTIYTALMIDRAGVLNSASLEVGKGWQGPDTIGNGSLVSGARVSVIQLN
jgi:hypothetical protein